MINARITEDKKFKEAIGAFIIAFSELEHGLAKLGSMTEFDLRKKSDYLLKHIGFPFEKKVSNISEFIEEHLIDLKPIWNELKVEIGQLNQERRFIAHGFIQYFLPFENSAIPTFAKKGKELIVKKHNSQSIKALTNRIHHLNTGKNGINGEFSKLFTVTRVDQWNSLVHDQNKIIYKVNNKILSEWKGK